MKGRQEKLTLKSDLFKTQKTPQRPVRSVSKTPTTRSPAYRSGRDDDKIDPNDLFQKVCCPNCRYLFKIMKNTQFLSLTPPKRKEPAKLSAMMQTDDSLLREIRELKAMNQELSKQLASKMTEAVVFKSNSAKMEMAKIEEASEIEYIKEKTYKFEDMNGSKLTQARRSSIISEKRSETSSLLLKSKNQFSAKQKDLSRKQTSKNEVIFKKIINQQQLRGIVIQNHRNQILLQQMIQFQKQLPPNIEIPAYQKMIIQEFTSSTARSETR